MGIFSFLKAPETMGKALDAVIAGGDALVYTEEEKGEMRKKMAEVHLKHIEISNQENTATSIARRWFAMVITIPFVLLTLGSAFWRTISIFVDTESLKNDIVELAVHYQELAMENYATLVMMVAVFYFGNHMVKSFKK